MAVAITDRLRNQLLIGWSLGVVVTILGITASYVGDLPTGPAIIGCYAVVMLLVSGLLYNIRAADRLRAAQVTAGTVFAFAAALGLLVIIGRLVQSGSPP
jgi:hypothetical protein